MTSASLADFSAAFPWFFPVAAFLLGACIGSFLNVVIYRVPKGESIVSPGSHCACGQPIKWYDNIPILSWLLLRGRARCCGRRFSFRYPFVELLTAVLFTACWLQFRNTPLVAVCGAVFVSSLLAATFIDLDHMIIPDVFTIGLGVLGVLLSFWVPQLHVAESSGFFFIDAVRSGFAGLVGLLIGSGLVLWIAIVAETVLRKEAMGFGDVKFVGAIGAFCGWKGAIFAVFGGALVGTVWFILAWIWEKVTGRRAAVAPPTETPEGEAAPLALGAHVPFGPMLAIAGVLYFLVFHGWVDAWLGDVTTLF
ncbi:MAG TPA: prepilin peptidase [Opitutaceae bacterium]|nr:prepilin peptidase [Opitutaceae bacterium]